MINVDNVKLVATNLASIHAAEGKRAQIALEMIEAEERGDKASDVAAKYGMSVRKANQLKRLYLEEAERISHHPVINGMSLLSLPDPETHETQPQAKEPSSTSKAKKSEQESDEAKRDFQEHGSNETEYVRYRMKYHGKTSSAAKREYKNLSQELETA